MSWIKINVTLPRSPKILLLGQYLGISRYEALGLAVEWLTWLDGITTNGEIELTAELMDRLFYADFLSQKNVTEVIDSRDVCHTNIKELSHALEKIGWIHVGENNVIHVQDFEKHNGETAKKRVENAERQRKSRKKKKEKQSQENITPVTKKCDQIREDKNIYNSEKPNGSINTVCGVVDVPPGLFGKPKPESAEEVRRFMAGQAVCGLQGEELAACANGFFDDMEACGWTVRNGNPLFDWHAAARKYLTTWQRNLGRGSKGSEGVVYRSQKKQNYDL